MTFSGKEPLEGGIYLIILPNKTYFEMLINDEQRFTLETDTLDYVGHLKVTGSLENQLFNDHQKFLMVKGLENQALKARMEANKNNQDSAAAIRAAMTAIDREVKEKNNCFKINNIDDKIKIIRFNYSDSNNR